MCQTVILVSTVIDIIGFFKEIRSSLRLDTQGIAKPGFALDPSNYKCFLFYSSSFFLCFCLFVFCYNVAVLFSMETLKGKPKRSAFRKQNKTFV